MIWFLGILVVAMFVAWAVWPRSSFTERRRVDGLGRKFRELLNGSPKLRILILEVSKDGPFLQFSHDPGLVANFPLVTGRHKNLESKFRRILENHRFSVFRAIGSDGARFLEVQLPESPENAASLSQSIMVEVFGLKPNARIKTKLMV